jgi:hypothetical protein
LRRKRRKKGLRKRIESLFLAAKDHVKVVAA